MSTDRRCYGVMGRFADADALLEAARACRERHPGVEAYTPCPVAGLEEALGLRRDRVPAFALAGGLFGAVSGFLVQYYTAVLDYPIDVGGRPLLSWPAFLPITILLTLFWGAAGAVLGLLVLQRLPRLYHPVFNVPDFAEASRGGFFLVIPARGPDFDPAEAGEWMRSLGATTVEEVSP